jgi:hypothetical protein
MTGPRHLGLDPREDRPCESRVGPGMTVPAKNVWTETGSA